ncbi:MAG: aryl-sulfate sulfotransferase [Deltaproteobacteria bacterium]|nr:aryl-sulfate sulfotransferase [Deltaproteobacteria bacterium]
MTKKIFTILFIFVAVIGSSGSWAQDESWDQNFGVIKNDTGAFQGYTLFAPISSTITYLINMDGELVNTWESDFTPGQAAYLLGDGHLLRAGSANYYTKIIPGGGSGGRVQDFTWDGDLVWDYSVSTEKYLGHHDVEKLPNGNVLIIAWEIITAEEAIFEGRNPETFENKTVLVDYIFEVEPIGMRTGEIVWEWHVLDHLIQDYDPSKQNYGDVASHPELININYKDLSSQSSTIRERGGGALDWTHINSVDYNPELDQIILSVKHLNEIWIIDHNTTTEEAAGHFGGKSGRGGDLLYRWGNPQTYQAGTTEDQQLFSQHDAQWIPSGLPGAGNILLFNNEDNSGNYSSVCEIIPPVDEQGRYLAEGGKIFGPDKPEWKYTASQEINFTSKTQSGAQRLPNGNTLISSSRTGTIYEVTPEREIVWEYIIPAMMNNVYFKAYRYGPDYPGLAGRDLTPNLGNQIKDNRSLVAHLNP